MKRCFVAQPFDGAEFDKRYVEIYEPAIKAAGLEPYRVDFDPSASIVIDTIIDEIRSCAAFFVDISSDNPNVWFEFGLAIAFGQEACIVCAEQRPRFPFDVQHRNIIKYKNESVGDFKKLESSITARLKAILDKRSTVEAVEEKINETTSPRNDSEMSDLELLGLGILVSEARYTDGNVPRHELYDAMEKAGYLPVATSVAIRRLERRGFVETGEHYNGNYNYIGQSITSKGWEWIEENLDNFQLKKPPRRAAKSLNHLDDDIPF